METLLNKLKNKEISQRQFISKIKNNDEYIKEVIEKTQFLNEYNPDILERLYYIINNLNDIIKCPYCNNKAKWTGRINEGYKTTCCSKECESKRISEQKKDSTIISENRNKHFIDIQNQVTYVNDDIIKNIIQYESQIALLTNENIINYLKNRYNDSDSLVETYKRIKLNIEIKPVCPVCGNPVTFIGKKNKMFTTYCSNECAGKSKETIAKKKKTQLENWGTENCYDSEKYKQLCKEKYGVEYVSQRNDVKKKKKETFLKKYGVEYVSQNEEIKQKIWETYKKNCTGCTSKEEEQIYLWLQELGYNVEHHYKSNIYPFNCDFYIKDYDLYIEYQGSYFHNKKAYLGTKEDINELNIYKEKVKILESKNKNPKLKGLIDTWYTRDVNKRMYVLNNKINFLEIYSCISKEHLKNQIELWYNCFINNKIINYSHDYLINKFNTCKNIIYTDKLLCAFKTGIDIIKYFQENKFYKKEKEIYANNPILRRKLIQNRIHYLNKKEDELTDIELLTGFKKSAIHYGYSHFNPQWTNWFINKYNIKTIYDPCGGWGHHMLGMINCEKIIYNDIDEEIYNGVYNMKQYFNIDNLECHNNDAQEYIPEDVDAFFMCPPYYNVEIYNEDNIFKDIEEYKKFLNNIFNIWENNDAKIFGLIIREDFVNLIDNEYSEKYEVPVNKSHFVKNKEKKNKEYFYIYKKG